MGSGISPVDFDCNACSDERRIDGGRFDDSCELRVFLRRGLFFTMRRPLSALGGSRRLDDLGSGFEGMWSPVSSISLVDRFLGGLRSGVPCLEDSLELLVLASDSLDAEVRLSWVGFEG